MFIKAFFYAFRAQAVQKSYWLTSFAVIAFYLFNKRKEWKLSSPYFQLILMGVMIFFANSLFTALPLLISNPDPSITYHWRAAAVQGMGRYNLHSSAFLALAMVLAFKELYLSKRVLSE